MTAPITAAAGWPSGPPLDVLRGRIDRRLRRLAPPERPANGLTQAVRYALLAPGKRIRPLLLLLACRELGRDDPGPLDAACALEMVHAASLVLDDLPAMDDAALRRGQPSTHVAFGEDVAILASISLLGSAFSALAATPGIDPGARTRATAILAGAIGSHGLAAGQYADLRGAARPRGVEHVVETNHRKTGVLFVAAIEIAAAIASVDDERLEGLKVFATHLGHAFQLLDDLHDEPTGGDGEDSGRATLLALLGRSDVRQRLEHHLRQALAQLRPESELGALARGIFAGVPGQIDGRRPLASSLQA